MSSGSSREEAAIGGEMAKMAASVKAA